MLVWAADAVHHLVADVGLGGDPQVTPRRPRFSLPAEKLKDDDDDDVITCWKCFFIDFILGRNNETLMLNFMSCKLESSLY